MKVHKFFNYFWVWTLLYFVLGFFNILFAWLGMFDFMVPLLFAVFGGNKFFCNHMCGRAQLFTKIGHDLKCSTNKPAPQWLRSKAFRYGFLVFFVAMFSNILFQTWLVASGARNLREAVRFLLAFKIPWSWAYTAGTVPNWAAQFSFGFYSIMLTSAVIGLLVMVLFRPRTWCVFCPMGTVTQVICKLKDRN